MVAPAISPLVVGRYAIFDRIAAGGMAAVHLGRLVGEGGFARTVAIKRLHPQYALDPDFVAMFLDEARLASRIRHPNVVPTLDVVTAEGELFLVMEYVEGEALSTLLRIARERNRKVPIAIAAGIMAQALHGLQAAHDARNDHGEPLEIVHRDVSPQNILVGAHGIARVLDFGVAKALGKLHTTREGQLKGKLGYLAPEQVLGQPVTRRSDVFAAAVVLWEALVGRRLFEGESEGEVLRRIMEGIVERPSAHRADVSPVLDEVVLRALAREPADRFDTANAMAEAIEGATSIAGPRAVGDWVRSLAGDRLAARAALLAAIESGSASLLPPRPSGVASGPLVQPESGAGAESSQSAVPVPSSSGALPGLDEAAAAEPETVADGSGDGPATQVGTASRAARWAARIAIVAVVATASAVIARNIGGGPRSSSRPTGAPSAASAPSGGSPAATAVASAGVGAAPSVAPVDRGVDAATPVKAAGNPRGSAQGPSLDHAPPRSSVGTASPKGRASARDAGLYTRE